MIEGIVITLFVLYVIIGMVLYDVIIKTDILKDNIITFMLIILFWFPYLLFTALRGD